MEQMIKEKKPCYAYYRVSREDQKIDTQKHAVNRFIENNNIEVIAEFIDESISGALGWERESLTQMFKRLRDNPNEVEGIIVYAWDRISREEEFSMMLVYSLRKFGKVIYEAISGTRLDFDKFEYRAKTFFDSALAQRERERINQRQKDAIKRFQAERGYWGRKIVYGINPITQRPMSKDTFWKRFEEFRVKHRLSKSAISRIFQMSYSSLKRRIKEYPLKLQEIEKKYKEHTLDLNIELHQRGWSNE